jgi:anti-sigma regulatory factor (Ser/Thr protein kinase)
MAVHRTFPSELESVHRAQEFVGQLLGGPAFDTAAARTITSELVSNAVRHGEPPVDVTVSVTSEHAALIEVADGRTEGEVSARRPPPEATSGRGLLLVNELAESWGVERRARGKVVWARVAPAPLATESR